MKALTELSPEGRIELDQSHVRGWVKELGVIIIDETTKLVLRNPAEHGWSLERGAEIVPLPSSLTEPEAIAA